mmetsp:Transcript_9741/g.23591  ORF Transcript_9741/g.23591 Transcript_9741/m.23591 type:complete len:257 (+) Transcript_9741:343-1113(+)
MGRISLGLAAWMASIPPSDRIGPKDASDAMLEISDPLKPLNRFARTFTSSLDRSVSPAFSKRFFRRALRVVASGKGTYILRGNRLRTAESMSQGQFVAAMTSRCFPLSSPLFLTIPSMFVINSVLKRRLASCSPSDFRLLRSASISSTNIIDGAAARATSKRVLRSFSPSPCHLLVIALAVHTNSTQEDSCATALTNRVFPVPGGPYKRMFRGFRKPEKRSGRIRGKIAASWRACFASLRPAMSFHVVLCNFEGSM